jgi:hypothetical protein
MSQYMISGPDPIQRHDEERRQRAALFFVLRDDEFGNSRF